MAQNVTINMVAYSDVPAVDLPRTGGGTARFVDTSDATATAGDILSGKTAYVNGSKITGTILSKAAKTYTPTTSNQTIEAGQYLSGSQTILGDANLIAENIAEGVTIFGIVGTHRGAPSTFTVVLYGGVSETVSYTGTQSGTVSLSASGVGAANLPKGSYVFTGGVSGYVTGTVSLTEDTTVYVRPQKIVYWYGIKGSGITFYTNLQSGISFTENTNEIIFGWNGSGAGGTAYGIFRTSSPVSFSGYTKIKFRCAYTTVYSSSYFPYFGFYTSANTNVSTNPNYYIRPSTTSYTVYSLNTVGSQGYIGARNELCGSKFQAIWLE